MQSARHPLADLVDRVREHNGWSDPQVVARARERGFELSKSNISRVRNQPVVSLTRSTIEGLAAGLGIPPSEVARAALESMGIELADAGALDLETVIRLDTTLPLIGKEMLLTLVRQMRARETRRADHEDESAQGAAADPQGARTVGDPGTSTTDAAERRDQHDNVYDLNLRDEGDDLDRRWVATDREIEPDYTPDS